MILNHIGNKSPDARVIVTSHCVNCVPKSLGNLVPTECFIRAWWLIIQGGKAKLIIKMIFQSLIVTPFRSNNGVVKRMGTTKCVALSHSFRLPPIRLLTLVERREIGESGSIRLLQDISLRINIGQWWFVVVHVHWHLETRINCLKIRLIHKGREWALWLC